MSVSEKTCLCSPVLGKPSLKHKNYPKRTNSRAETWTPAPGWIFPKVNWESQVSNSTERTKQLFLELCVLQQQKGLVLHIPPVLGMFLESGFVWFFFPKLFCKYKHTKIASLQTHKHIKIDPGHTELHLRVLHKFLSISCWAQNPSDRNPLSGPGLLGLRWIPAHVPTGNSDNQGCFSPCHVKQNPPLGKWKLKLTKAHQPEMCPSTFSLPKAKAIGHQKFTATQVKSYPRTSLSSSLWTSAIPRKKYRLEELELGKKPKTKKKTWLQPNEEEPTFESWPVGVISWSLSALLCHFIDPSRLTHSLIAGRINSYFCPENGFKTPPTATKKSHFTGEIIPWPPLQTLQPKMLWSSDQHRAQGEAPRKPHRLGGLLQRKYSSDLPEAFEHLLSEFGIFPGLSTIHHQRGTPREWEMPEWGISQPQREIETLQNKAQEAL